MVFAGRWSQEEPRLTEDGWRPCLSNDVTVSAFEAERIGAWSQRCEQFERARFYC